MGEAAWRRRVGRQPARIAEQTRRDIVDAALEVFSEVGFGGASLRDIAARAGTTHGLIRHYFGSKEGVWRAVVEAADAKYVAALMPVLDDAAAPPDEAVAPAMAEIVRGLVSVSARHPEIVRLLVHEGAKGGERLDHILERIAVPRRLLAPLFARLQRQGFLRQFDEDTFFLFLLTAGVMPFALPALTVGLTGEDIFGEKQAERQADRIIQTLFDESTFSARRHQQKYKDDLGSPVSGVGVKGR